MPSPELPRSLSSDSSKEPWEAQDRNLSDSDCLAPKWRMSFQTASEYKNGDYSINNMDIRAGELGIKLFGRGNRITNSRIEVTDSRAGIYIFGPDNVIENNIIVFRGTPQTNSAAPIKLHHGDGTVIRNNLIILEHMSGRQAVSLIETQGIELSGNRVFGAAEFVRLYAGSDGMRLGPNALGDARDAPALDDEVRRADAVPGSAEPGRLAGPR
ncbi:MAG: right-handed parallel beta-helix repeat-containing protein [Burkholderiaceae bacterium]